MIAFTLYTVGMGYGVVIGVLAWLIPWGITKALGLLHKAT